MPVRPVYAICLDVDVHGVDAHVSIALENLLVAPVWYGGIQAADFIVIGDVEKLPLSYGGIKKKTLQRRQTGEAGKENGV